MEEPRSQVVWEGKQENLKFFFIAYADAVGWRVIKPAGTFSARGTGVWVGDKDTQMR